MTFFILGSHHELSKAEIKAVLGNKPVVVETPEVLVLNDVEQSAQALQERLAGTVKIGQIIGEMDVWNENEVADLIASFALEASGKNKISFGISAYSMESEARELGKLVKARLKHTGRPIRFVTSKQAQLSSVIVEENGLLSSGGEYVIMKVEGKILIGQTETVQNYKAWSERDYGRPERDAKSGMLPPKLARLMINLSGIEPSGKTILDPFCGSGTVLAEAMLLGFAKLIGSDISEKAIENTSKNLAWLSEQEKLQPSQLSLHTHDVRTLSEVVTDQVDLIVTETYLGEPRTKLSSPSDAERQKKELFALYEPAFKVLKSLLVTGGRMVIALPAFKTKEGMVRFNRNDCFASAGFHVEHAFLYSRPDQFVAREIFVLS